MESETDHDTETEPELAIHSLRDACSLGIDLVENFPGDVCAVWLGTDEGKVRDFVICTRERAQDVEEIVGYAALSAALVDADRAVVWRTVAGLDDAPALADTYFLHLDRLAVMGVTLLDEIVMTGDELRSMAITTFTDRPGWDDISALLEGPDCP